MVIKTILDTDLYKFTTSYAYIKLFPYAMGTFTFIDRDDTEYTEGFLEALKSEIHNLSMVQLTSEELEYMASHCRFLPRVYWEWLSSFRFDPDKIEVGLDEHRHLQMRVTDYLYKVTLYEVPLLAIVSEIRNQFLNRIPDKETLLLRLADKVKLSNDHQMPFSEFGTRRRFSFHVQKLEVAYL